MNKPINDSINSSENENTPRVFSKQETADIAEAAVKFASDSGSIKVSISSWWGAGQRWSRNKTSMSSDQRDVMVKIESKKNGGWGEAQTNQIDLDSLKGVIGIAEYYATESADNRALDRMMEKAFWNSPGSNVWSDKTFDPNIMKFVSAIEKVTKMASDDSLLSAGYVGTTGNTAFVYARDEWGRVSTDWGEVTEATCSMTVRHPKGLGSGWAARTSFDISKISIDDIANKAYDKCKASLDPVRIEPGRYTAILEPQAVGELLIGLLWSLKRIFPEQGHKGSPILGGYNQEVNRHYSKLGWKIVDERINLYHDPEDPFVGTHKSDMVGKVNLITNGILTTIFNSYTHEVNEMSELNPSTFRTSFRMDGTDTSTEEMIRGTRKGILITKLAQSHLIDPQSLLFTGVTRDGLWLIENGKISKAVRNFRWIESPMFIFNNIDQIGIEEPISSYWWARGKLIPDFQNSLNNRVVPTMKVRDFNFSSTIDAI